jgi:hypothetical protein
MNYSQSLVGRSPRAFLVIAATGLSGAFVFAPSVLLARSFGEYQAPGRLEAAVANGLIELWSSGSAELPAELSSLADYWFFWHAIKVGICILLLMVLALLAIASWRACTQEGGSVSAGILSAVVTAVLVPLVVVVLLANVQSVASPLVSLLQVLPGSSAEVDIAATVQQISAAQADPAATASFAPFGLLADEIVRYHLALTVASSSTMVITAWIGVRTWVSRMRDTGGALRKRRLLLALSVSTSVAAVGFALIAAESFVSALNPAGSLLDII